MEKPADRALTSAQIETLVRRVYPEAQLKAHQPLPSRGDTLDYELCITRPTLELTLRLYPPNAPRPRLEKEAYVLPQVLQETGVPVPQIIHLDMEGSIIGQPWSLLTRLPGQPLGLLLPLMDDADRQVVGEEMGRYLARLHSVAVSRFGEYFGEDPLARSQERAYVLGRLEEWAQECQEHELLPDKLLDEVRQRVSTSPLLNRPRACLVHGDYHEDNINVEAGMVSYHVTGIFGFAYSCGWSPEWDMTGLFSGVFEQYPTLERGFLDGYADVGEIGPQFWDRLRLYQTLAAVRQVTHAHRAGQPDKIEEARQRLERLLGQ